MTGSELITTAQKLLREPASTADCRRAVSTAYYALFSALCRACSDSLVGQDNNRAKYQVYRALDHSNVKERCRETKSDDRSFPDEVRVFADTLVDLYELRELADYCPEKTFDVLVAKNHVDQASKALENLAEVSTDHMKAFAVFVLLKPGKGRGRTRLSG
jgi:hypothetical protein